MNEKLKEFINGIGVMCETWMITYNNFVKMGLSQNDALLHTKHMTTVILEHMTNKDGTKNVQV